MIAMTDELLQDAAQRARDFLNGVQTRPVGARADAVEAATALGGALPETGCDMHDVLARLDGLGSPAATGNAGPRYFGFVTGGTHPAALAANWLAAAWDQNGFSRMSSPIAAIIEDIAIEWLVDLLHLPEGTGGGFVTGATTANFTALAAARSKVLADAGWNVEAQGLFGAPDITVIVGEEAHPTLAKSLGLLGLGRERVRRVPVDAQGRMRTDALPDIAGPAIVCLQAGNVNSGAFDPAHEICPALADTGAWVHVDGAFGLWAAASREQAHLFRGYELAHSWAGDAHKWLNVSYDSGLAFVREPRHLSNAMGISASYLPQGEAREPFAFTPESSRRARGIEIWAVLSALGREGVSDLVARNCAQARRLAEGLAAAGHDILNEVSLNQVVAAFGDAERTGRIIAAIQEDGTCWCGGTNWRGRTALRLSVSSWATSDADIEQSLDAIVRIARETE